MRMAETARSEEKLREIIQAYNYLEASGYGLK